MIKNGNILVLVLILIFLLNSCSMLNQSNDTTSQDSLAAMDTSAELPEATETSIPIPTATNTVIPTETPTLTPTVYPLSLDSVLEEIAIQKEDIIEFYKEIGISTDKFVDGSLMVISPMPNDENSFTTWGNLYPKFRELEIPPEVVKYQWMGFVSERDFQDESTPLYLATHTHLILVFNSPEEAEAFYKADIENMPEGFKINMPKVGDESIGFSGEIAGYGFLGAYAPFGGVIWRYEEVYCAFMAQMKFVVTSESLITISQNIQERLVEALE